MSQMLTFVIIQHLSPFYTLMKVLFFLLFTFTIAACSKKEELSPSLANQVAGSYTFVREEYNGFDIVYPYTHPTTGQTTSGKIEVTKLTDENVSAKMVYSFIDKTGKVTSDSQNLGEATLKQLSTGEIEAYQGKLRVAIYANNELRLSASDPDLGKYTLVTKK